MAPLQSGGKLRALHPHIADDDVDSLMGALATVVAGRWPLYRLVS